MTYPFISDALISTHLISWIQEYKENKEKYIIKTKEILIIDLTILKNPMWQHFHLRQVVTHHKFIAICWKWINLQKSYFKE